MGHDGPGPCACTARRDPPPRLPTVEPLNETRADNPADRGTSRTPGGRHHLRRLPRVTRWPTRPPSAMIAWTRTRRPRHRCRNPLLAPHDSKWPLVLAWLQCRPPTPLNRDPRPFHPRVWTCSLKRMRTPRTQRRTARRIGLVAWVTPSLPLSRSTVPLEMRRERADGTKKLGQTTPSGSRTARRLRYKARRTIRGDGTARRPHAAWTAAAAALPLGWQLFESMPYDCWP
jgi:hypothetical protein